MVGISIRQGPIGVRCPIDAANGGRSHIVSAAQAAVRVSVNVSMERVSEPEMNAKLSCRQGCAVPFLKAAAGWLMRQRRCAVFQVGVERSGESRRCWGSVGERGSEKSDYMVVSGESFSFSFLVR